MCVGECARSRTGVAGVCTSAGGGDVLAVFVCSFGTAISLIVCERVFGRLTSARSFNFVDCCRVFALALDFVGLTRFSSSSWIGCLNEI